MIVLKKKLSLVTKFTLLLLLSGASTYAQVQDKDSLDQKPAMSLSVQPLFLISNAAKLDLEIQLPKRRLGYIVSAEVYAGRVKDIGFLEITSGDRPFDRISGFGLGVLQKHSFREGITSYYVAYGITYRHLKIDYETDGFSPYQQDGLNYYEYGPLEKSKKINTLLLSTTIGYHRIMGRFVYDLYLGLGYKSPLEKVDFNGARDYNDSMPSFAYKGFGILAGIKLGFQFH